MDLAVIAKAFAIAIGGIAPAIAIGKIVPKPWNQLVATQAAGKILVPMLCRGLRKRSQFMHSLSLSVLSNYLLR